MWAPHRVAVAPPLLPAVNDKEDEAEKEDEEAPVPDCAARNSTLQPGTPEFNLFMATQHPALLNAALDKKL